jgi:hypothetical protein
MTSVATDALADALAAYAGRFHAAVGPRHHVASPLGAWLLLALVAAADEAGDPAGPTHTAATDAGPTTGAEAEAAGPAAEAAGRGANGVTDHAATSPAESLAEALGMPTEAAARHARELLDHPHPAIAAATAAWTRDAPAAAARWLAALPASVERGPVPSQDAADAWARRHTLDMIDHFPLTLDHTVLCVLANALATRISWTHPFTTTGSDAFRSDWRERVATVLRTPDRVHACAIARHPVAGEIGIHRAHAEGLAVTSVIAAPHVPADAVVAAAHDAARDRVEHLSLADLPLGDGPAWTVTESTGTGDRVSAVLPAWSATSEHDLRAPSFGFAGAAAVLGRLFGATAWDATQAATARYHREGFEAAAVTAVAVRMSFRPPGKRREAELRFDHPYAVVATATGDGPWAGLPVFSAWVTEPEPPTP